jgi:hypothetical protein
MEGNQMARKKSATPAYNLALLGAVVAATRDGNVLYVPATDDAKLLVDNGMIAVDTTNINPDTGEAAASATEQGTKFMAENETNTGDAGNAAPAAEKPKFVIDTGPMPTAKRNVVGASKLYPFDDLPAPTKDDEGNDVVGRFFVPATTERPEPWKTLASTVSSASKRYAKESGTEEYKTASGETKTRKTFTYDRKFRLYAGEREGVKGAFVARVK